MIGVFEMLCFLGLLFCGYMNNPVFFSISLVNSSICLYFLLGLGGCSWLGMSIVLIFSGGMMVVFLYMTSLCTNYKYRLYPGKYLTLLGGVGAFCVFCLPGSLFWSKSCEPELWEVYSPLNLPLLAFLAGYLFMVLLLCVFICEKFKGVMRKRHTKDPRLAVKFLSEESLFGNRNA